ncbi:MAG: hypothetical protein LUP94_01360 [Candidatus Methanomethylicus sp.]|nr:hypothetical protein [Candidatus Methanomethylicus sp.]
MLNINIPDMDGNYGRFPEKALRVAALIASLENNPRIEINHWACAQEIVERWRRNLHELYRQINEEEKEKKELTILGKVKRAIIEKGFPTKREIEQYTGLSSEEVGKELDKLKTEGRIIEEKVGKTYRYRRASQEKKEPS